MKNILKNYNYTLFRNFRIVLHYITSNVIIKKIVLLFFIVFIVSCATGPKNRIARMQFPVQEYKELPETGSAVVKGQAFLKTRGGDVKVAAGNEVILNPVTSYSKEWYRKSYVMGMKIVEADPRVWDYVKKTVADGNGRFKFNNVPAGEYYVTTAVVWEAPTGFRGSLEKQGGIVTKKITVKEGDEIDVIVTR